MYSEGGDCRMHYADFAISAFVRRQLNQLVSGGRPFLSRRKFSLRLISRRRFPFNNTRTEASQNNTHSKFIVPGTMPELEQPHQGCRNFSLQKESGYRERSFEGEQWPARKLFGKQTEVGCIKIFGKSRNRPSI